MVRSTRTARNFTSPSNHLLAVTTDQSRLDVDLIHEFITNYYWAQGRSKELVTTTLENSLCFGVFVENEQVGFAPSVLDRVRQFELTIGNHTVSFKDLL